MGTASADVLRRRLKPSTTTAWPDTRPMHT